MNPVPISERQRLQFVNAGIYNVVPPNGAEKDGRENGQSSEPYCFSVSQPPFDPSADQRSAGNCREESEAGLFDVDHCRQSKGEWYESSWPVPGGQLSLRQDEQPGGENCHCSQGW